MANILVFGNSMTYGCWDEKGGWVTELKQELHQETLKESSDSEYFVYNLGISGDTTEGLLKRFKLEADWRIDQDQKNIIIFQIGINDSCWLHQEEKNWISLENFTRNLKELIAEAKRITDHLFFLNLTPVIQPKVDPIPWDEDKSYLNEKVERYNQKLKQVCQEKETNLINIRSQFKQANYSQLLEDGLHPNRKGHHKIYQLVKERLKEEDLIEVQTRSSKL